MLWPDKAKKYLKKYWNIEELKDKQFQVINELLLGNDVIGLLPTGYGKSMCYLIPPLVTKRTMIIISPLISLMEDQKEKLNSMNIPCTALHSNNSNKIEEYSQVINGDIKIIYMSPEYLIKADGIELASLLIENNMLGFLAIDEAHCISSWGHDFRPEYAKIKIFREKFPSIPILAVTATATEMVCKDIVKLLNLTKPKTVRASFDRPNLYFSVKELPTYTIQTKTKKGSKTETKTMPKHEIMKQYIDKYPNDKIIVYANSRNDCEELAEKLNKIKKNCADAYHAGLNKDLRESIQTKFSTGEVKIIVSTIAFGMGIDQIVKCVIIFGCPSSIEEYYQQIGRGGRDGLPCETILYFNYSNLMIGKSMIKDIKNKYPILYQYKCENLDRVGKFAYIETCRRKFVLEYFNDPNDPINFFNCNNCDNCCEKELVDMTEIIWPIVMRYNVNMITAVNEFRTKYLTQVTEFIRDKYKIIELDLIEPLKKWKKYIMRKNITLEDIPDKMRLRIPKKFIKPPQITRELTLDDKIKLYESLV
jgi:ATP-dependent DNA helicase RecQ